METLPLDLPENNLTIEDTVDYAKAITVALVKTPKALLPELLSEEVSGLNLSHSKQKGDCLYLYSQDRKPSCAKQILEAIAPSTQNLESSVLFAEGIRRLKLHGTGWALGVDLPVSAAAIVTADIIRDLLKQFRVRSSAKYTAMRIKLKLLLQNNCLNLLCETPEPTIQAEIALPILETLRNVQAAAYFQSVTVSNRVIGEQKPHWSFEIDLLAIGIATEPDADQDQANPQPIDTSNHLETELEDELEATTDQDGISVQQLISRIGDRILTFTRPLWSLHWLGTVQPSPETKFFNVPLGLLSLAIGLGSTIILDRTLSYYVSTNTNSAPPTSLASSTSNLTDVANPTALNADPLKVQDSPKANFNISSLNEKIALIDWQTNQKQRSPDVLIVGSSRALRGINPTILEQSLKQQGYKNISVFNFGIDGATAQVVNIQLTQILKKYQLPKIIIWADGLRAFNSRRKDTTYEEITASVGYQQLQANLANQGSDPQPTTNAPTPTDTPFSQALTSFFSTASQRQEVRQSVIKSFDQHTQSLSNSEAIIAATAPKTAAVIDTKGFMAFDITFDATTYFQKYPLVPGDYDLDYRDFETNGSQFDALDNVVEFCQRHNIQLVIINMPLHHTYLDRVRLSYEATFNQRMDELAQRGNFTYINLSQTISEQAKLFSDPSHLNKDGAIAIAQNLAQNPKMPWQWLKSQK
ncbi:MAG: D-alanyl-lipoteichoic acid biosynthesis protein DltD [Pseudanabaenaceae cyanobacterium bins.39]|nr:D-alanyl-lipoteichoic acid biosynthesis protein DltD [Pseudanabaenaceae cyanobacterium bins.39]